MERFLESFIMITMKRGSLFQVVGLLAFLAVVTGGVVLYAQGFRLNWGEHSLDRTGMILAKSVPDGARVSLDGELKAATNSTISSLQPGTYHLKIEKEGYLSWEKDMEVKEELATDVTALLPPVSPSLTAITQSGAKLVTAAPSGTKAVFLSGKNLFLLALNNQFLGFLRTRPQEIAAEPADFPFSKVTQMVFSPNEDRILLIAGKKGISFRISAGTSPTAVLSTTVLLAQWSVTVRQQRQEAIQRLEIPEEYQELALDPKSIWDPDERKFIYEKTEGGKRQIWVANFTDPLPVGEETNRKILETENKNLKIFWLANSQNFTLVEGDAVSIMDLDGTNKREIFKGTLGEKIALSSTDSSQVIVLTSISTKSPANLYGISLR